MKHFYDKNKLLFTLVWIAIYVVSFSLADKLSAAIGIQKVITAPLGIGLALGLVGFVIRNRLSEEYGLCKYKGSFQDVLFFLPLVGVLGLYLCNGVTWNGSACEAVLCVIAMLCVGLVEEMLFRGFLFKTMCEDNTATAILVSSLTFGLGTL